MARTNIKESTRIRERANNTESTTIKERAMLKGRTNFSERVTYNDSIIEGERAKTHRASTT